MSGAPKGHATIRDVAQAAGVSIGTVSKAMNGSGSVGAETRARVMQAVETLGYRPNSLAQSLHRTRSMTVGLITNDSFGRFTNPIVEALESRLAALGVAVFMCNATDDPERERAHLAQLLGKRVDGIVVTSRRTDQRPPIGPLARHVPVVYVFSHADDPEALSLVPDDQGGAAAAVAHLAGLGRRRIAHLTGPLHFGAVRLRRDGWRAALAEAGLQAREEHFLSGAWSEAWGRETVARLFAAGRKAPDALFCGNDQIARGAVDALRERGLSVPGDVAVVGFDNWEVMTLASRPPLSSVDLNLKALGREAGTRLIQAMHGEPQRGLVRLPCTLIVRDSSILPDKRVR
jgi:LacI family transcriptional regulator